MIIVHDSDLHYGEYGSNIPRAIKENNPAAFIELNPDMVIVTGDLTDNEISLLQDLYIDEEYWNDLIENMEDRGFDEDDIAMVLSLYASDDKKDNKKFKNIVEMLKGEEFEIEEIEE